MNATARAMAAALLVAPTKNGGRPKPGEFSAMDAALMADCHRSLITDALLVLKHGTPAEITRAQNGSGLSAACARIRAVSRKHDGEPQPVPSYLIDIDPNYRGERTVTAWVGERSVSSWVLKCRPAEVAAGWLLDNDYPDGMAVVRYGDLLSHEPRPLSHLARGMNWSAAAC